MGVKDHHLLNYGTLIELLSNKVAGGADQFDSCIVSLAHSQLIEYWRDNSREYERGRDRGRRACLLGRIPALE